MAKPKRNTRQKMINLMYLVFIAMLAINYPEEILDGFDLINEKLFVSLQNTTKKNQEIYKEFELSYATAPEKTAEAYKQAQNVKRQSDSLYIYINDLKLKILELSDGKDADLNNIIAKDNLDASSVVMFNLQDGQGKKLRLAIDAYRTAMSNMVEDPIQKQIIENSLSTEPSKKRGVDKINWEQASFESMPTIASITYLTELQSNIRTSEGTVLNNLLKEIDIADLRVNRIKALVVPQSNVVMRGSSYSADIIMAAVDSTQQPTIVVNGKELDPSANGFISIPATSIGKQTLEGYISVNSKDGSVIKRPFLQTYTVIEPMVTIAPTLMDVLYANYKNPLSISVPGVPIQNLSVSATGGSVVSQGNTWVATPSKPGQNMTINVTFRMDGNNPQTLSKTFRVRQLPDPSAFIVYTDAQGNQKKFRSGLLARTAILQAGGIQSALDDGILNIPFKVLSFKTQSIDAMGNTSPEVSDGAQFSARQIEQIKRLQRGKTLIISTIKVQGPDGTTRDIYPMEVRIN